MFFFLCQVIVTALIMGLNSISFIALILFMFYYMFGIVGMILFRESDPWHFGTLHMTIITLFRCSTLEDWTDVMYVNMYGCKYYGYEDSLVGGPGNFEDVGRGWISQECALPEDKKEMQLVKEKLRATGLEYVSWGADSPDTDKEGAFSFPQTCEQSMAYREHCLTQVGHAPWLLYAAPAYFLVFIVIGAFILLTLFIGVVTTSMEEATEDMKEVQEVRLIFAVDVVGPWPHQHIWPLFAG